MRDSGAREGRVRHGSLRFWPRMHTDKHRLQTKSLSVSIRMNPWLNPVPQPIDICGRAPRRSKGVFAIPALERN